MDFDWIGGFRQTLTINNGILEGLNSVLQAAKRKARGYKVEHFKTIAYLLTGKLDFSKLNSGCQCQSALASESSILLGQLSAIACLKSGL